MKEDNREKNTITVSGDYLISIIALLLGVISIFGMEYKESTLLVSVLGILVTGLVGWNIMTVIDARRLNKRMKETTLKYSKLETKIELKLKNTEAEIRAVVTDETIEAINMLSSLKNVEIDDELCIYFKYFYKSYKTNRIALQLVTHCRINAIIEEVLNKDFSYEFLSSVAKKIDIDSVQAYIDSYNTIENKYTSQKKWLYRLLEQIDKKNE